MNIPKLKTAFFGALGWCFLTNASAQPNRVIDIAVTGKTGTTITLSWTAPFPSGSSNLASNDLRMSTSPINALNFASAAKVSAVTDIPGTPGTVQTYTTTGLNPNTRYYYALKVYEDDGGISPMSNLTLATSGSSTCSLQFVWNPTTDPSIIGFNMYYGVSSRTYTTSVNAGFATTITISNLDWYTDYFFAVTGYDTNGIESDYSNEVSYQGGSP